MKKVIDIDNSLLVGLKVAAAKRNLSLKKYIESALPNLVDSDFLIDPSEIKQVRISEFVNYSRESAKETALGLIEKYEAELATIPINTGQTGKKRRSFLESKIKALKKELGDS